MYSGMPLIEWFCVISPFAPSEWTARTTKGKILYVRFYNGVLTVREDSKWDGREIMRKTFPSRKHSSYMKTEEMLWQSGFKLDHERYADVA